MICLQLGELLRLMNGGVETAVLPRHVAVQAAEYAAAVWTDCGLPGAEPMETAYSSLTQGSAKYLCHFDTGTKDQYLIIVCSATSGEPEGCLPLDIGGQYRPVTLRDLSTGFVGRPTEEMLAEALPHLVRGEGTPAAILESGEGSYLQTYQDGPDEYVLEYQLVTTRFHFAVAGPVATQDVMRAFRSYAFGRYEWARELTWQHRPIPLSGPS